MDKKKEYRLSWAVKKKKNGKRGKVTEEKETQMVQQKKGQKDSSLRRLQVT